MYSFDRLLVQGLGVITIRLVVEKYSVVSFQCSVKPWALVEAFPQTLSSLALVLPGGSAFRGTMNNRSPTPHQQTGCLELTRGGVRDDSP